MVAESGIVTVVSSTLIVSTGVVDSVLVSPFFFAGK